MFKLRKKVLGVLVTSVVLSGCTSNREVVIDENIQVNYDYLTSLIQTDSDTLEKYDFSNTTVLNHVAYSTDYNDWNFGKGEVSYSDVVSEMNFRKSQLHELIIWPDSLSNMNKSIIISNGLGVSICDHRVIFEEWKIEQEELPFYYLEYVVTFDVDANTKVTEQYDSICRGDYICSRILYRGDEIVAFSQTGIGSRSSNVLKIGDMSSILSLVHPEYFEEVGITETPATFILNKTK